MAGSVLGLPRQAENLRSSGVYKDGSASHVRARARRTQIIAIPVMVYQFRHAMLKF